MGLKIWLPLNNTLENKGVSDYPITKASAVTFDASGKIGYCAAAASSANITITVPDITTIVGEGTQYSLACWVKIQGRSVDGWVVKFGSNSCGLWWGHSTARWVWNENDNGKRISSAIASDTTNWHHITVTVDKTTSGQITTKQYVDGVPAPGYPGSTFSTPAKLPTGTTITINPYVAYLNDIRIYDRCLSAAEVREISQGLVLHYKLDDFIRPNLLTGNINDISAWVANGVTATNEDGGIKVVDNGNSYRRIYNSVNNVWLTNGEIFTVSFDARSNANGQIIQCSRSATDYAPNITLTTSWAHYSAQITNTTSTNGGTLSIQSATTNGIFWIKNIKLEKGSVESKFLLPGDTNNLVQDSSGYNHTTTTLGSPILVSNSPRYSKGLQFNGTTDAINCGLDWQIQGSREITVSCWIYDENWSNSTGKYYFSSQQTGGFLISQKENNQFRFRIDTYTDSALSARAYKDIDVTVAVESGWHHFVGVYTTSALKIYIDGELKGTNNVTTYGAHFGTATSLFLGAECAGKVTAEPFCACSLSDFRFYYTALSDEDIQQLYHLGAKIDNQHNIHTFNLVEDSNSVTTTISPTWTSATSSYTIRSYSTAGNSYPSMITNNITSPRTTYTSNFLPIDSTVVYKVTHTSPTITRKTYSYTPYTWVTSGSGHTKRAGTTVYGYYCSYLIIIDFYDSEENLLTSRTIQSRVSSSTGSSSFPSQDVTLSSLPSTDVILSPINEESNATQIKIRRIYTGATIKSTGTITVKEGTNNKTQLYKTGNLQASIFQENEFAKIKNNNTIEANEFIEI